MDVLHLRDKVTVQRIPRALRLGASLRRGNTSRTVAPKQSANPLWLVLS